jgi:hypothetical protein
LSAKAKRVFAAVQEAVNTAIEENLVVTSTGYESLCPFPQRVN